MIATRSFHADSQERFCRRDLQALALVGSDGPDILKGGAGQDPFIFGKLGWVDTLKDFDPFDDTIALSAAVFATPDFANGSGGIPIVTLRIGSAAADPDDRLIYDPSTGKLSYDIDETGPIAPILFAQLPIGPAITAEDFLVV